MRRTREPWTAYYGLVFYLLISPLNPQTRLAHNDFQLQVLDAGKVVNCFDFIIQISLQIYDGNLNVFIPQEILTLLLQWLPIAYAFIAHFPVQRFINSK